MTRGCEKCILKPDSNPLHHERHRLSCQEVLLSGAFRESGAFVAYHRPHCRVFNPASFLVHIARLSSAIPSQRLWSRSKPDLPE
jgi:hypothetical protein